MPRRKKPPAHMVRITFPVWKLSGNRKVASTASIWIHSALADEVVQIFTEIFNDPEQFPIHSVGGYSWRGNNSSSEHNPGLAIDINPNENYQIRYGNVVVGSFWDPASSPYSIPEDGSVVRILPPTAGKGRGCMGRLHHTFHHRHHDYMLSPISAPDFVACATLHQKSLDLPSGGGLIIEVHSSKGGSSDVD